MNTITRNDYKKQFLFISLIIVLAVVLSGAVTAAELPLITDQSGMVSGDLYFDAQQPTPWSEQPQNTGVSQEASFEFAPHGYTDIEYAKLYTMVYVAGTDARECKVEVDFDGNNDGTYETNLESTTLNTASSMDGTVYYQAPNINRVYSDYILSYDVKDHIQNNTVNVRVETSPGADNMDGRIKFIALAVAYNDGDDDQVYYWVNDGHQWMASGQTRNTTFDTTPLISGWDSAQLKMAHTSSSDANYTFNGEPKTGGAPVPPAGFLKVNTWDVTDDLTAGENSNLTYTKETPWSYKTPIATLKVKYGDLEVTSVTYNPDNVSGHRELFANQTNLIRATIKNNGTEAKGEFEVTLNIDGYSETINVPGLASGDSVDVDFKGYTPVSIGMKDVTVTADNAHTYKDNREVFYNGYKGKRYTDGEDLETKNFLEGNLALIFSHGDSAYRGSGAANWENDYIVNWSSDDLPIPVGSSLVLAKLYQGYTWNAVGGMPDFNANLNGQDITIENHFTDQKSYGGWDFPSGLMVYDVTNYFNTAGNTLTLSKGAETTTALYGSYLLAIYQHAEETFKQIWINEEADIIYSHAGYAVYDEEATAYANHQDVSTNGMRSAKAIAILASADEEGKSKYFFNGEEFPGFWSDYLAAPQIGFSQYDVTDHIQDGVNVAAMQSHNPDDPGVQGDYMVAFQNILVIEYGDLEVIKVVPAEGTVGVPVDGRIRVTFNEPIKMGSGWIRLRDMNQREDVDITTEIIEDELYITPKANLRPGTNYRIILHSNSLTDQKGNPLSLYQSNFRTRSSTPVVERVVPADGTLGVPLDAGIRIFFNQPIKMGSGWIRLRDMVRGEDVDLNMSIIGNELRLIPMSNLLPGTNYRIIIHSGSITSLADHAVSLYQSDFRTRS